MFIKSCLSKINQLHRSLSPGGPDQGNFVQSSSQHSNFDTHSLSRRSMKSRMSPMESNHAKVIANYVTMD